MSETSTTATPQLTSRREAIRCLASGIAALAVGACTPATILLKNYPEQYRPGTEATRRALLAFVDTVVPGLTPEERRSVTVLEDPYYPLAKYSDFLASDLDRRADRHHGRPFSALSLPDRTDIVAKALRGDATTRKLYTGAVFLTQAAVYGGIHDDRAGCRLTGFPGGYHFANPTSLSYPDTNRFAVRALSHTGNPA